jgi:hypothetical protein
MRNFRHSRKGRFRPNLGLSPKEKAIEKMVETLYGPHWKFWRAKLLKLITQNKDLAGRKGAPIDFGISYAGRAWFIPNDVDGEDTSAYAIMPLEDGPAGMEEELIKVTANLGELDIECYEVRRFLAGLLLFDAPPEKLSEALGQALFSRVGKILKEIPPDTVWNEASELSFTTYVSEFDYLIKAMCQRIMMNLITQDAFAAK